MNVLQVIKSDSSGGASVACMRLAKALEQSGNRVSVLCDVKKSGAGNVAAVASSFLSRKLESARFLAERLFFMLHEKDKSVRFAFSPANTGVSIIDHPLVKNADLLHLHWINQGFLSIPSLGEIVFSGKPVVWTLHDMWAFTGGCHYAGSCSRFKNECCNCPFLKKPSATDISNRLWIKKKRLFEKATAKIVFVTCSPWLKEQAMQSALLRNYRIETIPNPIDTSLFRKTSSENSRKQLGLDPGKKYILFGAMNIHDPRKGFAYLLNALKIVKEKSSEDIEVILFGKSKHPVSLPFPVNSFSFVSSADKLVQLFNASDVYVHPSLEDNLPNIIMESMACGTPVVAFNTGGIPSMIDHGINGWLADYKSAGSLAEGMMNVLRQDTRIISDNSVNKVRREYSEGVVAKQYGDLYKQLLNV